MLKLREPLTLDVKLTTILFGRSNIMPYYCNLLKFEHDEIQAKVSAICVRILVTHTLSFASFSYFIPNAEKHFILQNNAFVVTTVSAPVEVKGAQLSFCWLIVFFSQIKRNLDNLCFSININIKKGK
jgi:hypothetical protein